MSEPARVTVRIGKTRKSEDIRLQLHEQGLRTLSQAKAILLSAGYPHQSSIKAAGGGWAWECPRMGCHALTYLPPEKPPEYCHACGKASLHWTGREATAFYLSTHGGHSDTYAALDLALSLGFWLERVLCREDDAIITAWLAGDEVGEEGERVVAMVEREFEG